MAKKEFQSKIESIQKLFSEIDRESVVILKGHLMIEESLDNIICNFVHHKNPIHKARLNFIQKIYIAKSMSVSDSDHSMWLLIEKINTLRNDFSHNLTSEKRQDKIKTVIALYKKETEGNDFNYDWKGMELYEQLVFVISLCLGFLGTFEKEVDRFRKIVDKLDRMHNKPKQLNFTCF